MADPLPSISMSNADKQSYRLLVNSSTGYVAVKNSVGRVKMYHADEHEYIVIPNSPKIVLWPCSREDFQRRSRAPDSSGEISVLMGMPSLKELNCSSNRLPQLRLLGPTGSSIAGPEGLEVLNCSHNLIAHLDLSDLLCLEEVNVSNNRLRSMRLGRNLARLRNLDCSKNRLPTIDLAGLVALQHLNAADNLQNRVNPEDRKEGLSPVD